MADADADAALTSADVKLQPEIEYLVTLLDVDILIGCKKILNAPKSGDTTNIVWNVVDKSLSTLFKKIGNACSFWSKHCALKTGYRHLDLAENYKNLANVKSALKKAFSSVQDGGLGLSRDIIWLTMKVAKLNDTTDHVDSVY